MDQADEALAGGGPHLLVPPLPYLLCYLGQILSFSEPHLPQQGTRTRFLTLPLPISHFLPLPLEQTFASLFPLGFPSQPPWMMV